MRFVKSNLDKDLKKSYELVGNNIYKRSSLTLNSLKSSINLFTKKSIILKKPRPIDLELYGLVSGLPFSKDTVDSINNISSVIKKFLKNKICYWVKPSNLAVEYCVFKWPMDPWKSRWLNQITHFLKLSQYSSFDLHIEGIQVHADGCIIAKGYDGGFIRKIRSDIISNLNFVSKNQSNWAHIPIGRILEPISGHLFFGLKELITKFCKTKISKERITQAYFVHESRWYMEKKKIIYVKKFS
jgi:hypothetical protein